MTCCRLSLCVAILVCGCAHRRSQVVTESVHPTEAPSSTELATTSTAEPASSADVTPAAFEESDESEPEAKVTPPEFVPSPDPESSTDPRNAQSFIEGPILLEDVIQSVYRSYPLLESALYSRNIASGEQLAASGGFDLKLKGASENGPTGFYRTIDRALGWFSLFIKGAKSSADTVSVVVTLNPGTRNGRRMTAGVQSRFVGAAGEKQGH